LLQASGNLKEFRKVKAVKWQHDEADVILPVLTPHEDHEDYGIVRKKAGNIRKVLCVLVSEVQKLSDS
jgi:hypothetical protein